jgi:coenzyme F420-0:L-glutamate ligase / coenzyme F420-1:gamma-L-glutamate ligase
VTEVGSDDPTVADPAAGRAAPAPAADPTVAGPAAGRGAAAPAPAIEIRPVTGLPELRPGDDLAGLIAAAAPWLREGDIVVITSKAVSKVEGRLLAVPPDPVGRELARQAAIDAETVRLVASRGRTRIVQTRHGVVLASAGVDASNVRRDELALLPLDPDASASRLRAELRGRLGVTVAVVVSDTVGRPWRTGLTDIAIGIAGMSALVDLRGATDPYGNLLELTAVAVADEVAAAADLGKGKLTGIPAAVVRGVPTADDRRGARALVRPAAEDLFRLGTAEAIAAGRAAVAAQLAAPIRAFSDEPPPAETVSEAVPALPGCRFVPVPADQTDPVHGALGLPAPPGNSALLIVCVPEQAGPPGWYLAGVAVERYRAALAATGLAAAALGAPAASPVPLRAAVDLPAAWTPVVVLAVGRPLG